MVARGYVLTVAICFYSSAAPLALAFPTSIWPLHQLVQAPVLATCVVGEIKTDALRAGALRDVVIAHAVLRVVRSWPASTLKPGTRLFLDYEAHPLGGVVMNGPSLPAIASGDVLVLPLKLNPAPASAPWRLFIDEGESVVVPTIIARPPFAHSVTNAKEFMLQEIASALISGTLRETFAVAGYASRQNAIVPDLMSLLNSKLEPDDRRWSVIAASLLASLGVPRPTVAEFLSGDDTNTAGPFSWSLLTAALRKVGPTREAKQALIHDLLANASIDAWGVGVTLREFAQEPYLTRELTSMLRARVPGALSVARDILSAGQKSILDDAMTLSFYYLSVPVSSPYELQNACWIVRDFGSDPQFDELVAMVKTSQYRDTRRYDELWRNLLWSDNRRELVILNVLFHDDRTFQGNMRYTDIARDELKNFEAHHQ